MKLGLKQGLAKGLTIGSNSVVVYVVMAFLCWYGGRLVIYHGVRGGTAYNVGSCITLGGLSLGYGLSHLKYF
ncbi:putative Type I protein exporter [Helianthus anomalus]